MNRAKRYKLFDKQNQAWDLLEDPRFRRYLFDGGARSGKTESVLAWFIKEAFQRPGARILCGKRHQNSARTTLWNLSLKKILPPGTAGVRYKEGPMELIFPNSSMIRVGGFDDAERVDKILGDEYLHIFVNEATQISWQTITKIVTRLSQNLPGKESCLILDCNPQHTRHWLHQVGVQNIYPIVSAGQKPKPLADAKIWTRLHWSAYDNPHLPKHTIESLETLPGIMRERMLNGIWCDTEGLVYNTFDEDIHTFNDVSILGKNWMRYRAIDFGYTNPFVCLWGAVDGDGRLYIYREHFKSQMRIEEHAKIIKKYDKDFSFRTLADPEAAENRKSLEHYGVPTTNAKNIINLGIEAVKKRLVVRGDGLPRLFIHKDCFHTLNEFFSYKWPELKDTRNQDEKPIAKDDHTMDALRYMVMDIDNPSTVAVEAVEDEHKAGSASDLAEFF